MTTIGLASGRNFEGDRTTATRRWLCGTKMAMVGAIGFEPMTSTV
jgi:hypothetical protein